MELKKYFLTDQNRIGFTKNRVVDNGFAFVFSTETGKIEKEKIIATSDDIKDLLKIIQNS